MNVKFILVRCQQRLVYLYFLLLLLYYFCLIFFLVINTLLHNLYLPSALVHFHFLFAWIFVITHLSINPTPELDPLDDWIFYNVKEHPYPLSMSENE